MTDYPVTIADRTVTVRAFNAIHALDIADEMVSQTPDQDTSCRVSF